MKDSQNLPKKNSQKKFSKVHFFDTVVILLLLDIVAVTLCAFYLQKVQSLSLPRVSEKYLTVKSIPLSTDLESINASAEAYVVLDPDYQLMN
jgi:hypothetical protein